MKSHRLTSHPAIHQTSFVSQSAIIREEGRKTRATMWTITLVIIGCIIFSPFLFVAAPVAAVIAGTFFITAFVGACLGKWAARRREHRIMSEIRHHNDRVIPMTPPSNETSTNQPT